MSGRQQRESGIGKGKSSTGSGKSGSGGEDPPGDAVPPRGKGPRKQRASDLGRALRSVYDDTLREAVPSDFMDLLGKLR